MTEETRTDPPLRADEATTLRAFLDYHRDTFRWKCDGLTQEQLNTPLPPSDMTLGGMMKHLAVVESDWLSVMLLGGHLIAPFDTVDWEADDDWEWHSAAHDTPEELREIFDRSVAASDRIIEDALDSAHGLDLLSVRESRRGEGRFGLRWILVHLIEEYARHNGHADLIRESIDGLTGE
ncbi:DinB family protein [Nocardioides sp. KR10-350]|uniref:DinB family protein n=1 Tax=Nocardioides cheoyonin TaxID=3156615 RepID=UPI0032B441BE